MFFSLPASNAMPVLGGSEVCRSREEEMQAVCSMYV